MKTFWLVTVIVLGLAVSAMAASSWTASYCGMGTCVWTRITKVENVRADEPGLFRVQEQSCEKTYPQDQSYPKSYACRPNEISMHNVAVYCSKRSPRVAFPNDKNKWTIDYLSFDEDHNYHAIQWENRL